MGKNLSSLSTDMQVHAHIPHGATVGTAYYMSHWPDTNVGTIVLHISFIRSMIFGRVSLDEFKLRHFSISIAFCLDGKPMIKRFSITYPKLKSLSNPSGHSLSEFTLDQGTNYMIASLHRSLRGCRRSNQIGRNSHCNLVPFTSRETNCGCLVGANNASNSNQCLQGLPTKRIMKHGTSNVHRNDCNAHPSRKEGSMPQIRILLYVRLTRWPKGYASIHQRVHGIEFKCDAQYKKFRNEFGQR